MHKNDNRKNVLFFKTSAESRLYEDSIAKSSSVNCTNPLETI